MEYLQTPKINSNAKQDKHILPTANRTGMRIHSGRRRTSRNPTQNTRTRNQGPKKTERRTHCKAFAGPQGPKVCFDRSSPNVYLMRDFYNGYWTKRVCAYPSCKKRIQSI